MTTPVRVQCFAGFSEVPATYAPLLEQSTAMGFFHGQSWLEFLLAHQWSDSKLVLFGAEDEKGRPQLLAPLRQTELDGAVPYANTVASIGHGENYAELSLLFDPDLDNSQRLAVLTGLFSAMRQLQPPVDVLRLWPVEEYSMLASMVEQALRDAGFRVQTYTNSFNRYEDTQGVSWEQYLANRGSKQRYNIRRRKRNLEEAGLLQLDIYTGESSPEEFQQGMDDYILGTVESWKSPGSMVSRSMLQLIRLAASEDCLRLGVLKFQGRPIAGQFWLVSGGIAHSMRMAYHEDYKKWAPGVVLTAHMLEHLLDADKVSRIDFGLGNEEYKEKWMRDRRYYNGFMAFNPRTPRGIFFAAKHLVGQRLKRGIKRVGRALLRPLLGS